MQNTSGKFTKLDSNRIRHTQKVIGKSLYYACATDSTTLMAINEISEEQDNGTTATAAAVALLLDYSATYPDDTVR